MTLNFHAFLQRKTIYSDLIEAAGGRGLRSGGWSGSATSEYHDSPWLWFGWPHSGQVVFTVPWKRKATLILFPLHLISSGVEEIQSWPVTFPSNSPPPSQFPKFGAPSMSYWCRGGHRSLVDLANHQPFVEDHGRPTLWSPSVLPKTLGSTRQPPLQPHSHLPSLHFCLCTNIPLCDTYMIFATVPIQWHDYVNVLNAASLAFTCWAITSCVHVLSRGLNLTVLRWHHRNGLILRFFFFFLPGSFGAQEHTEAPWNLPWIFAPYEPDRHGNDSAPSTGHRSS